MKHQSYVLAVCVLLFLKTSSAVAQQPSKATLQGIVKHARTDEPIFGVRVSLLEPNAGPGFAEQAITLATATTDSRGEFVLSDVDPGAYRFRVGKNGFVRYEVARYSLGVAETNKDLTIRLTPTANLSGRISTTDGKPAEGVTLNLLKRTFNADGTIGYSIAATAQTNDLGEYRMFWVAPGRYYLVMEGGSQFGGLIEDLLSFAYALRRGHNNVPGIVYTETYYPGVIDFTKATLIDLQEGTELRGIDMTVGIQQLFAIRGRVLDAAGKPPARASITFSRRTYDGRKSSRCCAKYDPTTGTFEIPDLVPGHYGLNVLPAQNVLFVNSFPGISSAFAEVAITDAGINDLSFRMAVPPVISGQVKVEGQLPETIPMTSLLISLNASAVSVAGNIRATPAADGSFKLNAVSDTPSRIAVSGLAGTFYVKDTRLDGNDVLRTPGKFSAAGNLEVTISGNAGTLSGRIIDAVGKPVLDVEAVLIPNQSRDRFELFKRAITSAQGGFFIEGIAPGEYKLFAWERIEPNSFFDEDVLKQYEQLGTPVHIAESARETMDIRIIPESVIP